MDRSSSRRRDTTAGFTFVELLIAVGLSTGVLAGCYFFFSSTYRASTEQQREVSLALEMTELIETLQNDLYHAYYVVYEELAEPVLALVVYVPDENGLVRRVVTYRILGRGERVERAETGSPGSSERTRRFDFPEAAREAGTEAVVRFEADRATGRLTLAVGDRKIDIALKPETLAPDGTPASDAADWRAADELATWYRGEGSRQGWPEGLEPARSNPDGAAETGRTDEGPGEELRGTALPGAPVDSLREMPYAFLAGGDEVPVPGRQPVRIGDLGEAGVFAASSNLRLPGSDSAVELFRRGHPLGGPAGEAPDEDWFTLIPNPSARPGGVIYELAGAGPVRQVDPAVVREALARSSSTPPPADIAVTRNSSRTAPAGTRPSRGGTAEDSADHLRSLSDPERRGTIPRPTSGSSPWTAPQEPPASRPPLRPPGDAPAQPPPAAPPPTSGPY